MNRTNGVTWADVEEGLEHLRSEYRAMVDVRIFPTVGTFRAVSGLTIGVCVIHTPNGGTTGWERVVFATWPTYGHRTMTGLILRLIHQMDEKLLRERPQPKKPHKSISFPRD